MRGDMHHSKRNISSHQASRQEVAFLSSKSWQQKSAPPPSRVAKVFQALQVDMAACLFDSGSLDAASEWDTSNRLKKKKKKMCLFAAIIRRLGGAQAGSWQAITPPTVATSGIVRTVWKLTCLMMRHVKALLTWESRCFLAWLFCWTKQPSSQGCCCAVFIAATCAFPRAVCVRVSMKMRLLIQGRKLLILNGSKAFGVVFGHCGDLST